MCYFKNFYKVGKNDNDLKVQFNVLDSISNVCYFIYLYLFKE